MAEHLSCMVNVRMRQELYDKVRTAAGPKPAAEWVRDLVEEHVESDRLVVLAEVVALRKILLRLVVPRLMVAGDGVEELEQVRQSLQTIDGEKATLAKSDDGGAMNTREPRAGRWMSGRPTGMLVAGLLTVVAVWLSVVVTMWWWWTPTQHVMWRPYVKSSVAAALGLRPREYSLGGVRGRRDNRAVRDWLAREVYNGQPVTELVRVPVVVGVVVGILLCADGARRDQRRRQARRQGERVRGTEIVSVADWNRRQTKGL